MEYDIKLSNFEGPLDLLLHLIQKEQVDIKDIFVSKITGQYLEYMKQLDSLDMDKASEFINVAATILLIKARSLLPPPPKILENEEEEDPEKLLIRQLMEYNIYKEAGNQLRTLLDENTGVYYKLPEELFENENIILSGLTVENLISAFSEVLSKVKIKEEIARPREIPAYNYSVKDKIILIRNKLRRKGKVLFSELFMDSPTAEEVVITFVALLDLIKNSFVKATQSETFGDIILSDGGGNNE